jgi:hypothetical protein
MGERLYSVDASSTSALQAYFHPMQKCNPERNEYVVEWVYNCFVNKFKEFKADLFLNTINITIIQVN